MKILNKILVIVVFTLFSSFSHPIFVSVTEIEHNGKDKVVEISCKIFTNDFEEVLRKTYKTKIDLIDTKQNAAMKVYVSDYIKKHFSVQIDGKNQNLEFLGFEQIEEGIYCYLEIKNIAVVKNLVVTNNALYEQQKTQSSVVHATVNGVTKSAKAVNPNASFSFSW